MFVIEPSLAFLSGGEMLLVLGIALLIFGPRKLPQLARGLGEGLREFRKAANEIQEELTREPAPAPSPQPKHLTSPERPRDPVESVPDAQANNEPADQPNE
jgi:TatA/E family protein of Tat protein translocase